MDIIDCTNQKGGVSKSVTAYNLSLYISQIRNKRTLHLDADEQGNSGDSLPSYRFAGFDTALFFGKDPIVLPEFQGNLLSTTATPALRDIEKGANGMSDKELLETLKVRLSEIKDFFDYVVVDTAGSNSRVANIFLLVANYVFIPTTIDPYSIKITQNTLKRVIGVQQSYNKNLVNLGLLPTRIDTKSTTVKNDLESLIKNYSRYLLPARTVERQAYRTAAGKCVAVWDLKSTGAEREAGKEMLSVFDVIAEKIGV
ncbi:ParA family protein [Salmonella bongori]|jgi:chromosome partitioning protein|uniref:ParA family protein n=2 Tax=Salmonella enterica TaxID=28901 RepID=A0A5W3IV68_SALMU|nr:ParA family protein [Salmonella enterica]EBS5600545.1 ParA family protein [Salmonella enterica subsp. enterica serovar Monschaui]EBW6611835.1 ParA family protein [Salmonella enterica subsp. enterica serovar Muenchen]ECB6235007.1 ParA family protein [Salmonella enterica subsp. enterica serovar Minnesota]ECC9598925.1 ParA family protein [Salmonella bongori]EIM5291227.1 ParA family protein [Salmonella enterica subsp. enterica serovar Ealing]EJQ0414102.1 ParA family protein [Escherichia coli]